MDAENSHTNPSHATQSANPDNWVTTTSADEVPDADKLLYVYHTKVAEFNQLQKTHDEYVKSSCDYESELEAEIDRYDKKIQSLEQNVQVANEAKDQAQVALGQMEQELVLAQRRQEALNIQLDEMKWKIQRLEQLNDNLETANRIAQASIKELEHNVETLMEENVYLQIEKDDHTTSKTAAIPRNVEPSTEVSCLQVVVARKMSDASGPEPANQRRTMSKRKLGMYPDVVEKCLHMTCQNCQCRTKSIPISPISTNDESTKKTGGFFDRIRHRFLRTE